MGSSVPGRGTCCGRFGAAGAPAHRGIRIAQHPGPWRHGRRLPCLAAIPWPDPTAGTWASRELPGQGPEPLRAAPLAGRSYVRAVVDLVRQAAEAAHALHAGGVVHRDIKPGNLMVMADGSQVVLMDL